MPPLYRLYRCAAYRRSCLEHHPDKKAAGVEDEAEKERINEYFKDIQAAYAVLSDPTKRREYDSVDEFDDSLPSDCASEDFFKAGVRRMVPGETYPMHT